MGLVEGADPLTGVKLRTDSENSALRKIMVYVTLNGRKQGTLFLSFLRENFMTYMFE
jgi:hypothetical protein